MTKVVRIDEYGDASVLKIAMQARHPRARYH